jgi:hypothetical protein
MTFEIHCLVLIQKTYIGPGGSPSCLIYKLLVVTLIQKGKKLIFAMKLYDVSGKVDLICGATLDNILVS